MIWKPKPKELTQEEAVDLARKELSGFWHGLTPQITGIKTETGFVVVPLDPEFTKKVWLIFLIDPTTYSGQTSLHFAREWYRRYSVHDLSLLLILEPAYRYAVAERYVNSYAETYQITFPTAVDLDQCLASAFEAQALPEVLLLSDGRTQFKYAEQDWSLWKNAEAKIQKFLRGRDVGLSLSPLFSPLNSVTPIIEDIRRIELGFGPRIGEEAPFGEPGFIPAPNGFRPGNFPSTPLVLSQEDKNNDQGRIYLRGAWIQDAERVATSDPNAIMTFVSEGSHLSLVAQSLSKTAEASVLTAEIDDDTIYDGIAGKDLVLEESGAAILRVTQPKVYHVLQNTPPHRRQVTLRFPNADIAPVAIYGIRLGATCTKIPQ